MFAEGFVFGNVRVEVLERVLGDVLGHDDLVVSQDVSEGQS